MRTLEEIKYNYLHFKKYPNEEENKYYKISNESYIKWKTDYALDKKIKLFETIDTFENESINNNEDKLILMERIDACFSLSVQCNIYEDYYYFEIPKIFKKMYENDMFDYLTYSEYGHNTRYYNTLTFANQNFTELQPRALVYENQKYAGIIPLLYYSKHYDIFEEVLKYYSNFIYQKYGLYIQESMNVLIKMCKEYNLPYVEMLEDAKKRAKKLDYPAHHEYKYQFVSREDVEWE